MNAWLWCSWCFLILRLTQATDIPVHNYVDAASLNQDFIHYVNDNDITDRFPSFTKRNPILSLWGGRPLTDLLYYKRRPAFSSWGGKRGPAFSSWGGKRSVKNKKPDDSQNHTFDNTEYTDYENNILVNRITTGGDPNKNVADKINDILKKYSHNYDTNFSNKQENNDYSKETSSHSPHSSDSAYNFSKSKLFLNPQKETEILKNISPIDFEESAQKIESLNNYGKEKDNPSLDWRDEPVPTFNHFRANQATPFKHWNDQLQDKLEKTLNDISNNTDDILQKNNAEHISSTISLFPHSWRDKNEIIKHFTENNVTKKIPSIGNIKKFDDDNNNVDYLQNSNDNSFDATNEKDSSLDWRDEPNPEFINFQDKKATSFNSWGGKRATAFNSWGGKRNTAFNSWGGKRAPAFNSWGGKRAPAFNSWGGKRAPAFNSWGGKRAPAFNSWGGKRAPAFNSWGGKRAPAFNSWGGKRAPAFNSRGGKRAPAFNSWGGKRAPAFNSWGGKRAPAFNSWGGKRNTAFNSWGGKRTPAFNSWGEQYQEMNNEDEMQKNDESYQNKLKESNWSSNKIPIEINKSHKRRKRSMLSETFSDSQNPAEEISDFNDREETLLKWNPSLDQKASEIYKQSIRTKTEPIDQQTIRSPKYERWWNTLPSIHPFRTKREIKHSAWVDKGTADHDSWWDKRQPAFYSWGGKRSSASNNILLDTYEDTTPSDFFNLKKSKYPDPYESTIQKYSNGGNLDTEESFDTRNDKVLPNFISTSEKWFNPANMFPPPSNIFLHSELDQTYPFDLHHPKEDLMLPEHNIQEAPINVIKIIHDAPENEFEMQYRLMDDNLSDNNNEEENDVLKGVAKRSSPILKNDLEETSFDGKSTDPKIPQYNKENVKSINSKDLQNNLDGYSEYNYDFTSSTDKDIKLGKRSNYAPILHKRNYPGKRRPVFSSWGGKRNNLSSGNSNINTNEAETYNRKKRFIGSGIENSMSLIVSDNNILNPASAMNEIYLPTEMSICCTKKAQYGDKNLFMQMLLRTKSFRDLSWPTIRPIRRGADFYPWGGKRSFL